MKSHSAASEGSVNSLRARTKVNSRTGPCFASGGDASPYSTAAHLAAASAMECVRRSLHFLADPLEIDALRQDRRFRSSPHHGDRGWLAIALDDLAVVDWDEIAELLESGYRQVATRLIR